MRLALVFNGGVSLAVWMGGVAKEVDRFRSAFYPPQAIAGQERAANGVEPYAALLDALRTEIVADVVAGTSAGGINGAMLGYAVARRRSLEGASADAIRGVWERLGQIESLLDHKDAPRSGLNGDFLFQGCADVFAMLTDESPQLDDAAPTGMRLTITATDCAGYPVQVDGVSGVDHRLEMRFHARDRPATVLLSDDLQGAVAALASSRGWSTLGPTVQSDDSARDLAAAHAPGLLARAARTTASFPIAFAPSELPLQETTAALGDDTTTLTATPSMTGVLTTRTGDAALNASTSRYAVDGGIWDNAPFEAVLTSIDRQPAGRAVDRRLLYVVYTDEEMAPPPGQAPPAPDQPPALLASVSHTLTGPSNVSFADDLERIARDSGRQRARRTQFSWLLRPGPPNVFALALQLLPAYVAQNPQAQPPDFISPTATGDERSQTGPRTPQELEALPLSDWGATVTGWAWGIRPVQVAVETARWLLRDVLGELSARPDAYEAHAHELIAARATLSQLAWVMSDLADQHGLTEPLTPPEQTVCGHAMGDFAREIEQLHGVLVQLPAASGDEESATVASIALSAGDIDDIVRRALATEVAAHTLSGDRRPHKVDYTFGVIRPSKHWPLPVNGEAGVENEDNAGNDDEDETGDDRPQLAGIRYRHFGGFLRRSWRLEDWMWGRLDAVTCLVDILLDDAQIKRLTGGREDATNDLAQRLAAVAIPATCENRSAYLAYGAFAALRADSPVDPPPRPTALEKPDEEAWPGHVDRWRAQLAAAYTKVLLTAPSTDQAQGLAVIRADIRRRLQYAILDEERAPLIAEINADREGAGGPETEPLDPVELAAELDGGLRAITIGRTRGVPDLDLAGYAEIAGSNTLHAINKPVLADLAGAARGATAFVNAVDHAQAALRSELRHLRHHHPD
jgi:predicted acylesterase/phospholipase RssA